MLLVYNVNYNVVNCNVDYYVLICNVNWYVVNLQCWYNALYQHYNVVDLMYWL